MTRRRQPSRGETTPMPAHQPAARSLKKRLILAMLCLGVALAGLGGISLYGLYAYRSLVKSLSRMDAFRRASALIHSVNDLRVTVARLRTVHELGPGEPAHQERQRLQLRFFRLLLQVQEDLDRYRRHLDSMAHSGFHIGGSQEEQQAMWSIERALQRLQKLPLDAQRQDALDVQTLEAEIHELQSQAIKLPQYLRRDVLGFTQRLHRRWRTFFVLAWISTVWAAAVFVLLAWGARRHLVCPLQQLLQAAQRLAAGKYQYRLRLQHEDELAQLAAALNLVAERFRQVQRELEQKVQRLVQQAGRSDRLAGVGMLAAGVSHELNNPLASIALSAESLERRLSRHRGEMVPPDYLPQVRRYLELIRTEAARCHHIVYTLLEPPQPDRLAQTTPTALAPLVEQATAVVRQLAPYRQRDIQLELDTALSACVEQESWKQVVINLLLNALQATGPKDRVLVRLSREEDQAVLVVEDTGCGIAPQDVPRLFEPFFTQRRDGQGTGLGLFLVHRIVTGWGGQVEAHSPGPGQGAKFVVRVPRVPRSRAA